MVLKCVIVLFILASINSKVFVYGSKERFRFVLDLCKASNHGENWNDVPCVKKISDLIFQSCNEIHRCSISRKLYSLEDLVSQCTRKHLYKEWSAFKKLCDYVEWGNENDEFYWQMVACATGFLYKDKVKLYTEEFQKCQATAGNA